MSGSHDTPSLAARKDAARRAARARRKAAFEADRAAGWTAADALAVRALELPLIARAAERGHVVAAYRPIRTEIDPTPLMRALSARGTPVAVPVIEAEGAPLRFRLWTPDARMGPGPFGAEIPLDADEATPDLLLAPLLAFDRAGVRLGYGGGFYDRTAAQLRAAGRRAPLIALAYAAQTAEDGLPREETDMLLDAALTENETLVFAPERLAL